MKLPLVVPKIAKTCVPKVLPAAMDQSIRSMICKQEKNMSQTEMATLTSYFTDTFPIQQLSAGNRQLVMKWLAKRTHMKYWQSSRQIIFIVQASF